MEAVGMQLPLPPPGRRQESAGEVDCPSAEVNEEEEEEEEEDEDEDVGDLGSLDAEKVLDEDLQAQVLLLLERVEEAQEVALKYEDESVELRGFLEDERLASALQAENFTKEIQRLQAQMRSLKDEYDALEDEKEVEVGHLQQKLLEANEEIHSLRLDAEEAAALHANEVAGLQEEICRLKAELERVQHLRSEYDMEITALRAEISMKQAPGTGDSQPPLETHVGTHPEERLSGASDDVLRLREELSSLREQYQDLNEEYQILQKSNRTMVHQLERLEAIKYKSRSKLDSSPSLESDVEYTSDRRHSLARRNTLRGASVVSFKSVEIVGIGGSEYDEVRVEKMQQDSDSRSPQEQTLKVVEEETGSEAEEVELALQRAESNQAPLGLCEEESRDQPSASEWGDEAPELKARLSARGWGSDALQSREGQLRLPEPSMSPVEWEELHEELRQCKEEIQRLNGNIPPGGRVPHAVDPPTISLPLIGLVVIVAVLWCWWAETA